MDLLDGQQVEVSMLGMSLTNRTRPLKIHIQQTISHKCVDIIGVNTYNDVNVILTNRVIRAVNFEIRKIRKP